MSKLEGQPTIVRYADGTSRQLLGDHGMAQARREYIDGRIEIDEFERRIGEALILQEHGPAWQAEAARWHAGRRRDGD